LFGCSRQPGHVLLPIAIHNGWTDSSQEDLGELQEKYLRSGLWKGMMVFVQMGVTLAERDGEKLRCDGTPRDASS
jgi:hypothetical protein